MNDSTNNEAPAVAVEQDPHDENHPIRKPVSKFSVGQEVTYNGQPAKVTDYNEATGNYTVIHSTTQEVSEGDLTEI